MSDSTFTVVACVFSLALGLAAGFWWHYLAGQETRVLETREQIYSCMIDRYWEDGSSIGADAEAAVECMRETGVYGAFVTDFRG